MAKKIHFRMISGGVLAEANKRFKLTHPEIAINITGPTNPLSLQMMRDEVEGIVKPNLIAFDQLVLTTLKEHDKAKGGPSKAKVTSKFNRDVQGKLSTMKKEIQEKITAFCKENKADAEKMEAFAKEKGIDWKWTVDAAWTVVDFGTGVAEVAGGGAAALLAPMTAPVTATLAAKGIYDTAMSTMKLGTMVWDWWQGIPGAVGKVKTALKTLKDIQPPKQISKAQLTDAKNKVDELDKMISAIELNMRTSSGNLAKLLAQVDRGPLPQGVSKEKMHQEIQKAIDGIQQGFPKIKDFRPFAKEATKELQKYASQSTIDQVVVRTFIGKQYERFSPLADGLVAYAKGENSGIIKGVCGFIVGLVTG